MSLPKELFHVIVERDGETLHERTFTHEMAKEWAADFGPHFEVTMGRYTPKAWSKEKRT